jgi:transposase
VLSHAAWPGIAEYKDNELIETKDWVKLHMICGVTTNVVTAAQVGERYSGDSPRFKSLVETTAQGFTMKEVSADKAYLSGDNLKAVTDAKATPYIPFKINSVAGEKRHSELWNRMYHYYAYNTERFMKAYHKRSNAESTFHMIKAKFGDSVRSKMERAQINSCARCYAIISAV